MRQPQVEPAHDIAGVGDAGQEGNALTDCGLAERFGEAGGHDELAARVDCIGKFALVGHCAGAHDRAIDLFHRPDRIQRGRRPQSDFQHPQATRDQRAGQRHGVLDLVDDDHGDDRRGLHDGGDIGHAYSLAKAAAAPNSPGCGWVMSLTGIEAISSWNRPLALNRSAKPDLTSVSRIR